MSTGTYLSNSIEGSGRERIRMGELKMLSQSLKEMEGDFIEAIRAVDVSSHPHEKLTVGFATIRRIRHLFSAEGVVSFQDFGNSRELVSAMHRAVVNKKIVLRSSHDIETLYFVLSEGFGAVPSLVDHYIDTGEILDVMFLVKERFKAARSSDRRIPRRMLGKLYAFDMSQQELGNQGDDEESASELPLEIRMNFAGCFDGNINKQVGT